MPKFNYVGVERISSGRSLFLMSDPAKALVDMVSVLKKDWEGAVPLLPSLRIEREDLKKINKEILNQLKNKILSQRVTRFVEGLMRDVD